MKCVRGVVLALAATLSGLFGLAGNVGPAAGNSLPFILVDPADCGTPLPGGAVVACQFQVKPAAWYPTGDGSWLAVDMKWTSWTTTKASGTATASVRTCWASCNKHTNYPVNVSFTAPVSCHGHLVFSKVDIFDPQEPTNKNAQWSGSVLCSPVPPAPPKLAGDWIFVDHTGPRNQDGLVVSVARLDLIDFPPKILSGSLAESAFDGHSPAMGPSGAWVNPISSDVKGHDYGSYFQLTVDGYTYIGGLGHLPPGTSQWYGCTTDIGARMPAGLSSGDTADLFILNGSKVDVFYRSDGYSGWALGLGTRIYCY